VTSVIVVIGAGSIGQAIARRVSAGKHVLLSDLRQDNVDAAAQVLSDAGFVNTISPGIIFTPLARDELTGPRGAGYRRMIELSAAGRGGTPDEVGAVGALLLGPDGGFITGSDFLMDGGVTAAYWFGEFAPK
jgi:NAD(P)-dependent dehydrogenase (short-subunit alcohol dehydrogenase family)